MEHCHFRLSMLLKKGMYKASSFNIIPHKYLHVPVYTVAKGGQLLLGG